MAMQAAVSSVSDAFALLQQGKSQAAIVLFRQLADRNDPAALATLAELNWHGNIVSPDLEEGRRLYLRAGDAGHVACASYGTNLLANGIAGERNWPLAIARLRREAAIDAGRAEMLALLSRLDLTSEGDPCTPPVAERLSESPEVWLFRGAFTRDECDYLMRYTEKPDFQRAKVIDVSTGDQRPDPIRTADESHIHWKIENPLIHAFNRRLAALSGTHVDQGEPLQILRYQPGQQYRSHLDFIPGVTNQRILTALLYLNDAYKGGETAFTRSGLTVRGSSGDVLLFRNVLSDGTADKSSEHAGLPVVAGTKFLATRWIRMLPVNS